MSEDERKRLDNLYAENFVNGNYSFWYDMKLILRTVPALFQKDTV
jgi:lipopolysaccharide/colanic/teichoic acid biosynthesis glycosyltransferase